MGKHSTVEYSLSASPDHAPALYAPYTWELSTPHRCLICDVETPTVPARVWIVSCKREWICSQHMYLVPTIVALNQMMNLSDIVLEFRAKHLESRAKHLLQQKRCSHCQTKKDLKFFKPLGVGVLKASDRLIVDESDKWFALCPRHKHLKKSYCDE